MFEQNIANRARALEGNIFAPYEIFVDIFEALDAFTSIDVAEVYRDLELLYVKKNR